MEPLQNDVHRKLTLWEEFQVWFRNTPRVGLIVIALLLLAGPLRGVLGAMFSLALLLAITISCLLILPAFLGAMAGKATGAVVRVARNSRTRR